MIDSRRYSPSTERNREPLLAVLRQVLPEYGLVLEVASGTGEHITHFAAALPRLIFQPTDLDADARASVDSWVAALGVGNVRPAIPLDATAPLWRIEQADAVLCINMIHISPWRATEGLVAGAARVLPPGGCLFLYGPYRRGGVHTAPSNAAFDESLRARNPEWGVRDLETVMALAAAHGFAAPEVEPMPANNLAVVFRRAPTAA